MAWLISQVFAPSTASPSYVEDYTPSSPSPSPAATATTLVYPHPTSLFFFTSSSSSNKLSFATIPPPTALPHISSSLPYNALADSDAAASRFPRLSSRSAAPSWGPIAGLRRMASLGRQGTGDQRHRSQASKAGWCCSTLRRPCRRLLLIRMVSWR